MNIESSKIFSFFKKNFTFILAGIIALIIFNKYILLILTIIFLGFLGIYSIKITKLVPHISIETISASSILISYVWGWKFGLGFALIIGIYGYALEGLLKLKSIINVLLMGLIAVIASIFHTLDYSFFITYMLCFIIRMILNNIVFPLVESDMFENMIHGFGDPLFNILITFQFMNILYLIIKVLGGVQ